MRTYLSLLLLMLAVSLQGQGTTYPNKLIQGGGTNSTITSVDDAVRMGAIGAKKDFLFNFPSIPNLPTDGIQGSGEAARLAGMYFDETRSTFYAGRVNHMNHYRDFGAQYSIMSGWSCQAVDPTGDPEGDQAKGQTMLGYANIGAGVYSVGLGYENAAINTAFQMGSFNYSGGALHEIVVHNWTNGAAPTSVELTGDLTATYTNNTMVFVGNATNAFGAQNQVNQVLSSSFSGGSGRTTVQLRSPMDYATSVSGAPYLDANNVRWVGYITTLGSGAAYTAQIGFRNRSKSGTYSVQLGSDTLALSSFQTTIGKQAVAKNLGEKAFSSGFLMDGTTQLVSQNSEWNEKLKTTDATPAALTINGSAISTYVNQIVLEAGSVVAVDVAVTVIQNDGSSGGGIFLRGTVLRDNVGAGAISILGQTPLSSHLSSALSTCTAVLTVDANKALQVTVTGVAGLTLYWNAAIKGSVSMITIPVNSL